MKGYLLDENLPNRLTIRPALPVSHSREVVGTAAADEAVGEAAQQGDLELVTKGADFSERVFVSEPPPGVVHLRFGNLRRRDVDSFLARAWPRVAALLPVHKLIGVFGDRIEAVR